MPSVEIRVEGDVATTNSSYVFKWRSAIGLEAKKKQLYVKENSPNKNTKFYVEILFFSTNANFPFVI